MHVALPGHQEASDFQQSCWGRPSQVQVALPGHRYDEPPRSTSSGRPSQMQVALPGQRDSQARLNEGSGRSSTQRNEFSMTSRVPTVLPSVHEGQPSRYNAPAYHSRSTRPLEPTVQVDRPQAGRTIVIRPQEPHHFGNRVDHARGEYTCTLCRCNNPNSHSDAYTMLNSPRGLDINGRPIDWQEAKRRMLDYHGKDQISHAEEIVAVPYVFDAETARGILQQKELVQRGVRAGYNISINVAGNNVDWHNDDGHAKPYVSGEGARTRSN
jgi:hypothetical protein